MLDSGYPYFGWGEMKNDYCMQFVMQTFPISFFWVFHINLLKKMIKTFMHI